MSGISEEGEGMLLSFEQEVKNAKELKTTESELELKREAFGEEEKPQREGYSLKLAAQVVSINVGQQSSTLAGQSAVTLGFLSTTPNSDGKQSPVYFGPLSFNNQCRMSERGRSFNRSKLGGEVEAQKWPNNNNNNNKRLITFRSLLVVVLAHNLLQDWLQTCSPQHHPIGFINFLASAQSAAGGKQNVIYVKVGALLEESNHEEANMFIRTIKMINERKDETIRQLLNVSTSGRIAANDWQQSDGKAKLGGIQSNDDQERREADQQGVGAGGGGVLVKLEPVIEFLANKESSLEADGKVCQLIESGVHAIVGPTDGASIQHVQSICDNMEIPYFELRPFLGSPAAQAPLPPPMMRPTNATFQPRNPLTQNRAPGTTTTTTTTEPIQVEEVEAGGGVGPDLFVGEESAPQVSVSSSSSSSTLNANNKLEELTLNLYPPAHLLTSAYIDLIYAWNWTSFAIVYEDGSSMIKLQDLFRESSGTWTSKWQIKLFQFNPISSSSSSSSSASSADSIVQQNTRAVPSGGLHDSDLKNDQQVPKLVPENNRKKRATFRDIFWRIKSSGEQNILLDVKTENLYEALKNAQQVGCMTERYSYLITSLDLHMIDLEDFKYSRTRMTAFNIIQVSKYKHHQEQTRATLKPSRLSETLSVNQRAHEEEESVGVEKRAQFDEKYLEKLGVHVISANSDSEDLSATRFVKPAWQSTSASAPSPPPPPPLGNNQINGIVSSHEYRNTNGAQQHKWSKYKLSASVVLDRAGSFMDPPNDIYKDWSKREQLLSSPASMGLLPSVDRDNEQKLFEFFVDQQERNLSRVRLSSSSAILHDSLLLYMLGLNELDPSGNFLNYKNKRQAEELKFNNDEQINPTCSLLASHPLLHGSSLVNYMRRISFTGLTGSISFDQAGLRSDFKLDMLGMAPEIGLVKVGEWYSKYDLKNRNSLNNSFTLEKMKDSKSNPKHQSSKKSYDELSNFYENELKRYEKLLREGKKFTVPYTKLLTSSEGSLNEGSNLAGLIVNEIIFERLYREQADQVDTLIVTTKLSQPYFMLKETPNKLEGNDQYEGFAVDLIHELSKLVNFRYRWREVEDKKYGSKEVLPNGTVVWNGMIGEIVRGLADLAIVDLTITAQREEAVDFTLPFMNTGISILFKKPTTKVTTLFSFLSPFSPDVWAYVLAAYCGISAILFVVGHLSPYEWADPHPCRRSSHYGETNEAILKNQFSLLNSFWFTIGSLMQQGSDLTPRSMSTRTIAGIWYFFTLIMISSYTANLAAFLTVEKVVYPIENVRDLSDQKEIKYGCVESGSTCTFFHDSQIDTYKKINETMHHFRTYVRSIDEGQKRVEDGKFAFFMESASIEYIVERNCNLTQIGGLLDSKGFGLATNKKSRLKRPYRTLLSEGILHLQETGMLHILKNRWWKERRGGGTCTDDGKGGGVTELSLANVGGVFVVLLGGLGISFLVAIAEFMWRAKRSGSSRDRMCEEMMSDLKFALACKRSTKPVISSEGTRRTNGITSSKGSRRQLARQQSSLMSAMGDELLLGANGGAGADVDAGGNNPAPLIGQRQVASRHGKDCDPILFHAMLTMLMQQQQQQQTLDINNTNIRDHHLSLAKFAQEDDGEPRTTGEALMAMPYSINGATNHHQWLRARRDEGANGQEEVVGGVGVAGQFERRTRDWRAIDD